MENFQGSEDIDVRERDTIFALSSGGVPSGVAVVRLSGSRVGEVARAMIGSLPPPRQASLRWVHKRDGERIDQGVVISFPGPASFTGEDCLEFQIHGGRAVLTALLEELRSFEGLRHAEAGEFSRRAFDNGRLDLVEIEGLADLISADTEMQRRLALEQSSGRQSTLYRDWATRLTRIRALVEAELDFPDEDDVPGALSDTLWPELERLRGEMMRHLDANSAAEIIRDGFKVAIVGAPNAGKSSLLNALARREIAIVTDVAGTTRDVLGVDLAIGGYLIHIMDTAGIRDTDDVIEREGVRRAFRSVQEADLVLLLQSPGSAFDVSLLPATAVLLSVQSKSDLLEAGDGGTPNAGTPNALSVSAKTGHGLDSLSKRILEEVRDRMSAAQVLGPARRRQADLLRQTVAEINQCLVSDTDLELKAEYLRLALHCLGKITGDVDVEALLEVIFSEFCIGK